VVEAEVKKGSTTEARRHGEKRRKIVFRRLTAKNNLGGFERLRYRLSLFLCDSVVK
jgi:hypothetical protein